jgi:hypothetical protein
MCKEVNFITIVDGEINYKRSSPAIWLHGRDAFAGTLLLLNVGRASLVR